METLDIFKALSNEYRLQMLLWLKNPQQHFTAKQLESEAVNFDGGVCVGSITEKAGLAQSVVSSYLNALKQVGLVETQRVGKWTYYRYNASAINQFIENLYQQL
ncbi:ArsR/SmtB family transcription factor [Pelistega ratti]|uniref:ArsR/SmtB family transcription factor n=1 Tax=Pelistega ratti TaxID=2652177 RepID=UPI0013572912|nr:metalloregulator ArsR/SmtB family transcription factor [Pelistega ratti]